MAEGEEEEEERAAREWGVGEGRGVGVPYASLAWGRWEKKDAGAIPPPVSTRDPALCFEIFYYASS